MTTRRRSSGALPQLAAGRHERARERRTRVRRAGALAGLLAAVALAVVGKAATAPPPRPVVLADGRSRLSAPAGDGTARSGHRQRDAVAARAGTTPPIRSAAAVRGKARTAATTPAVTRGPRVRSVTGAAIDVGYGIVQVRATFSGARITDVTAVSLPQGGNSGDISVYAAPRLRAEVLAAQSPQIDTVSGASFTSEGYARSLQSALDRARI